MSGFVATGGASGALNISNADFWPDIDGQALRTAMRFDSSITNERLTEAAIAAMIEVNRELDPYRTAKQAEGFATLDDVPAAQINQQSQLLHHYRRAVYCTAAAELVERYRSFDATNSGEQKLTEESTNVDELRRDARWAVRAILGRSRTTVELL